MTGGPFDGKAVLTVESLARDGALHPVQRAMADGHGSQCGFCTPGFVMSLYGRSVGARGTEDVAVKDVVAGNLCRCTGYGPILAAGEANPPGARDDTRVAELLRGLPATTTGDGWFKPRTADELAALLVELFPTRIRYTGMSLPYHIGNGWFGGLLPATAFAMSAAKGDIYYGLWYPIIFAGITLVVGLIFLPETKDRDIHALD